MLINLVGLDRYNQRSEMVLGTALKHAGVSRYEVSVDKIVPGLPIITTTPGTFAQYSGTAWNEKKRGYVYWNEEYQSKVIGTFNPDYIGRGKMGLIQALIFDLKLAHKKPIPSIPHHDLILYPTPDQFRAWMQSAVQAEFLVCDIETPYGNADSGEDIDDPSFEIIRVSFYAPGLGAITVPFTVGYIPSIKYGLLNSQQVVFWNADYDVPRLEFNGCSITGLIIDAMWLFHFLFPDLPRSLGSAGSFYTVLGEWKSLASTQPELYSALDSRGTGQIYLGIKKHLQEKGMWTTAWDHVVLLMQVLRKMKLRGLHIDLDRLKEFQATLACRSAELQTQLDQAIPDSLKPTEVIKAKHLRGRCQCLIPKIGKSGRTLSKLQPDISCVVCAGSGWNPEVIHTLRFNFGSSEQVLGLIKFLGHKVPTVRDDDGPKETTGAKFLSVLARQYPSAPYRLGLEQRKVKKMEDVYLKWPMKIISPTRAIVSTTLGFDPASGRLSSSNPNMQNIPKEGALANAFKKCIVSSPGHVLCKFDYSGIEAVLTGYFAGDAAYMRLALCGVHSYNCACYLGRSVDLNVTDSDLAANLKALKAELQMDFTSPGEDCSLYQRFKKANHMINYGAKHVEMFNQSPGVFKNLADAYDVWKFIRSNQPKLTKWHESVAARIKAEKRLVNPYMYNRYFWHKGDLNKAIAQDPQSTAAAIIKEAMLLIDKTEAGEFMVLQIHDELVFDFPSDLADILSTAVTTIMERPLERLPLDHLGQPGKFLSIKTERSKGLDFSCK